MTRPLAAAFSAAALSATVLAAGLAHAQGEPAARLLVGDQDAEAVSATNAGAVFNLDFGADPAAALAVEAAATAGAPFEFISGLALSPHDGRAYVTDLRDSGAGGAVLSIDGATGAVELVSTDAGLVEPFSATFLPDGRLVVADIDADPSGLGPDQGGFPGHGALWAFDVLGCDTGCVPELISDGTSFTGFPGAIDSAFEDPVGVAYDPVADVLYVADAFADPLGVGNIGALYAVDPDDGSVSLVASVIEFLALTAVAVRPDGQVLIVDAIRDDSVVWLVDPTNPDPQANVSFHSGGLQYALLEAVAVDAAGRELVADSGEYDEPSMTFVVEPAILRIDETVSDPQANALVVSESISLVLPVSLAPVPTPVLTAVSPPAIDAPTTVVVEGTGLSAAMLFDFGASVAVTSVEPVVGAEAGTRVQLDVAPVAGTGLPSAPPGCDMAAVAVDLIATGHFGGTGTLAEALLVSDSSSFVPRLACSTQGDASCDGIVDGVDLAILGRSFGSSICEPSLFAEDADFNGDDLVDGDDLAILATFFGQSP